MAGSRGFNLVEAAMVLGVTGLVIGGIWSAASMVRTTLKANEILETLMTFNERVQPLITRGVIENGWGYGDYVSISQTLGSTVRGLRWNAAAGLMYSDYGQFLFSGVSVPTASFGNARAIGVEFNGLARALCIRTAERLRAVMMQSRESIMMVCFAPSGACFAVAGVFDPSSASFPASPCAAGANNLQAYFFARQL